MRIAAFGLVAFSVVAAVVSAVIALGCGDRKSDKGGLPPAADWQAPASQDAAAAVAEESVEETLARCAARSFVDDAARDGNLPADIIDELVDVPDAQRAKVVLHALATAAARLPRADQHAMLLATATQMLVERGDTGTARAALARVETLIDRPRDSEFRPEIAAAAAARAWGRLGDVEAIERLGSDASAAPYLARGLAEGGHDQLADEVLARQATLSKIDPLASSEIAVAELIRGRVERARAIVAGTTADWRSVYAFVLAKAAVERNHPDAATLFADAAAQVDRETPPPPSMMLGMAELAQALGDTADATARRARARVALAATKDPRDGLAAMYNLYVLAVEAAAAAEAAGILGDMTAGGAAPWALTLARDIGLARTGELQAAVEDVARLPADAGPPRGVVHLEVLIRYLARPQRDPALERWLLDHLCDR